jgi:hypothetical protein
VRLKNGYLTVIRVAVARMLLWFVDMDESHSIHSHLVRRPVMIL